ncbi:Acetate operon repressor OS=Afipia felis OX=1035 GN=iclR_4 PE=4 SV=1 [Afipia felis]
MPKQKKLLPAPNGKDPSAVLNRLVSMLEFIAESGRPVSVSELVRSLDIPKPSAHRICRILESMGILLRDPIAKGLVVGPRLSNLAMNATLASSDTTVRRSILRSVTEKTGETSSLTILEGDELLFIDRVESASPLRLQLFPGSRVPLHCTSGGKLFLAHLPPEKRKQFLSAASLTKYTENTITKPEALKRDLDKVKAQLLGTDNEEYVHGLIAIAVPVFDTKGRLCSALSINAPAARYNIKEIQQHVETLRQASRALGKLLL